MRWLRWFRRRPDGTEAARAVREAQAKLRAQRDQAREVQRAVDQFTAAVEAAMMRRRA